MKDDLEMILSVFIGFMAVFLGIVVLCSAICLCVVIGNRTNVIAAKMLLEADTIYSLLPKNKECSHDK